MKLLQKAQHNLIQTYAQYPIEIVKGKGSYVWDSNGKKYLDFYGGHAVCLLGHCPPPVVKAIQTQSKKLLFYSNIFMTEPAILLAEKLVHTLKPKPYQVYFTNSGSEANEAAIKMARKHTGKKHIISFKNAFHGRSMTAIGVTGIPSYHQYKPNFDEYTTFATFGDMQSVKAAWKPSTAAIICEPIQSMGGLNMAPADFYRSLAKFCKEKNILLIFDEVQAGLGRTGTFWFAQSVGVSPDILTTAKGIAGGLPLSAVLVKKRISSKIKMGDHATTFGGGPMVCAAGLAVVNELLKPGFLDSVKEKETLIRTALESHPKIAAIRGTGLLLGIELHESNDTLVKDCLAAGLIISSSSNKKVFRIMPPLNTTLGDIKLFAKKFLAVLSKTST